LRGDKRKKKRKKIKRVRGGREGRNFEYQVKMGSEVGKRYN
jgi:hypothetical protein